MGSNLKIWQKHLLDKRKKALKEKIDSRIPLYSIKGVKALRESKNRFLAQHISKQEIDSITLKDF